VDEVPISRIERKKQETRERILTVAEQIFIVEGSYEQTTIREIAKRADVGLGSVYLHFRTKADILGALLAAHMGRIKILLRDAAGAGASGAEKLDSMLGFFDRLRRDKTMLLYGRIPISRQAAAIDEKLRRAIEDEFRDFSAIVADIFALGKADGTLRIEGDPALAAAAMMSITISYLRDFAFESDLPYAGALRAFGEDDRFRVFASFMRNALFAVPGK
jgi:AcrR family transcriptional regulator